MTQQHERTMTQHPETQHPDHTAPVHVIVHLDGGLVSEVYASCPVRVTVADHDVPEVVSPDDETVTLPGGDQVTLSDHLAGVDRVYCREIDRLDGHTLPAPEATPGVLYDLSAVGAVRLLGEIVQASLLTEDQTAELCSLTDLEPGQLDNLLGRVSDLWDSIKSRTGTPYGTPGNIATLMEDVIRQELSETRPAG